MVRKKRTNLAGAGGESSEPAQRQTETAPQPAQHGGFGGQQGHVAPQGGRDGQQGPTALLGGRGYQGTSAQQRGRRGYQGPPAQHGGHVGYQGPPAQQGGGGRGWVPQKSQQGGHGGYPQDLVVNRRVEWLLGNIPRIMMGVSNNLQVHNNMVGQCRDTKAKGSSSSEDLSKDMVGVEEVGFPKNLSKEPVEDILKDLVVNHSVEWLLGNNPRYTMSVSNNL